MPAITFTAAIFKQLTDLAEKVEKLNPDQKSNAGRFIARAFFWDAVERYAKKQSEAAWETLEKEEIIDTKGLTEGEHELVTTPGFIVMAKVSAPRKAFKAEVLMAALKKKYKVPEPASRELIEAAKVPGNGTKTLTIIERG